MTYMILVLVEAAKTHFQYTKIFWVSLCAASVWFLVQLHAMK